jgi:hypothetical protein
VIIHEVMHVGRNMPEKRAFQELMIYYAKFPCQGEVWELLKTRKGNPERKLSHTWCAVLRQIYSAVLQCCSGAVSGCAGYFKTLPDRAASV